MLHTQRNLAVLRTFSKAFGLAGLRCGFVAGSTELIGLLDSLLPPYAIPTPVIDAVHDAISSKGIASLQRNLETMTKNRLDCLSVLQNQPLITKIYPSAANFFLVQCTDATQVYQHLRERN